MKSIWLFICRFSYKQLKKEYKLPVGLPGHRDPNAICESYTPCKESDYDEMKAECETDGHYKCGDCLYNKYLKSEK